MKIQLLLCLRFELHLLGLLGIRPELDLCVSCRDPLTEYRLSFFHHDSGGIVCDQCFGGRDRGVVQERLAFEYGEDASQNPALLSKLKLPYAGTAGMHITPMVWKRLVLSSRGLDYTSRSDASPGVLQANHAARRLMQNYIEHKAGRRMRALDLITDG